jgi:hypothetical protein
MEKTTIMLPEDVHEELSIAAAYEGLKIGAFVECLARNPKPLQGLKDGKERRPCSNNVCVFVETRDRVKIAAIKSRVTMGLYLLGLLKEYEKNDILR